MKDRNNCLLAIYFFKLTQDCRSRTYYLSLRIGIVRNYIQNDILLTFFAPKIAEVGAFLFNSVSRLFDSKSHLPNISSLFNQLFSHVPHT